MKSSLNLGRITYIVIIFSFVIALLYLAQTILIPLAFAMVFALMLVPVCEFLEKKVKIPRVLAILLTFIIVLSLIMVIFYVLSILVIDVFDNIRDFGVRFQRVIEKVTIYLNENIFDEHLNIRELIGPGSDNFFSSSGIIGKTISSSTYFFVFTILVFVYSFLFLLYRTSFKKFILFHFTNQQNLDYAEEIIISMQKVAQNYFYGLLIVIMILGVLNGFGLWLIGLDYPFLFGFIAAFLAIIPYIGTFIGGLLPFLYALVNYDNFWIPVLVVLLYTGVQALEGNFITPKIVGSRVSLNPLFALLALIIGGTIWGVPGMILAIPLMAILKVVLDHIDNLRPYGILLGSKFGYDKPGFAQIVKERLGKTGEKEGEDDMHNSR